MTTKTIINLTGAFALACGLSAATEAVAMNCSAQPVQSGEATFYGTKSDGYAGGITYSGEKLTHGAMTAASNTFPMGTMLKVVWDKKGNKDPAIIVRVNDTGGFGGKTVIDLNVGAGEKLNMIDAGRIPVQIHTCK